MKRKIRQLQRRRGAKQIEIKEARGKIVTRMILDIDPESRDVVVEFEDSTAVTVNIDPAVKIWVQSQKLVGGNIVPVKDSKPIISAA